MYTQIILEGRKTEWRKSGERILLGNNTGGEVIRFLCAGVWISPGLPSIQGVTGGKDQTSGGCSLC